MSAQPKLTRFNQNVLSKYQVYNSIFMTLPFDTITKTGALLPLFYETCNKGFTAGENPTTIVNSFFKKYQARRSDKSQINLLFRFIQVFVRLLSGQEASLIVSHEVEEAIAEVQHLNVKE